MVALIVVKLCYTAFAAILRAEPGTAPPSGVTAHDCIVSNPPHTLTAAVATAQRRLQMFPP